MILVIDNYDSFTWNLVDLLRRFNGPVEIYRNDEISLAEIEAKSPTGILISPGPGRPQDSGVSVEVVGKLAGKIPILGVCLGHQLLGEMFGMELKHAKAPVHGKTSRLQHNGEGIFEGLPQGIQVMRYHSLVLANKWVSESLEITASTSEGEVMGIRHKFLNFEGVQFHPESVLTENGERIVRNWIDSLSVKELTHSRSGAKQLH